MTKDEKIIHIAEKALALQDIKIVPERLLVNELIVALEDIMEVVNDNS